MEKTINLRKLAAIILFTTGCVLTAAAGENEEELQSENQNTQCPTIQGIYSCSEDIKIEFVKVVLDAGSFTNARFMSNELLPFRLLDHNIELTDELNQRKTVGACEDGKIVRALEQDNMQNTKRLMTLTVNGNELNVKAMIQMGDEAPIEGEISCKKQGQVN